MKNSAKVPLHSFNKTAVILHSVMRMCQKITFLNSDSAVVVFTLGNVKLRLEA